MVHDYGLLSIRLAGIENHSWLKPSRRRSEIKKLFLWLAATAGVISTIAFWPQTATSASDGIEEQSINTTAQEADIGVLVAALKKAENEIQDPELRDYYHKLIEKYDIDDISSPGTLSNLGASSLPDIDHIVRIAIELPLQEAGKTITDPDIKDFYYDFLKDAGFEISEEQTVK